MIRSGLVLALICLAPAPSMAATLQLLCKGGGPSGPDDEGTYQDQIRVEINDDDTGRIRMPAILLPPLTNGDDGWFRLKKVERTDLEIKARAQLDFIDAAKIRIDRATGHISIDQRRGHFAGTCEKFEPAAMERKF